MTHLFATDLDGTLFNALHLTDRIILKGISKLIKRGDYFTIATGRNMRVEHIISDFKNLPIYCIAMNGAIIINPQKEIIYENIVDKAIIKDVLEKFPTINFEFIGRHNCYMKCSESENKKETQSNSLIIRMIYRRFKKYCPMEYVYNCTNEDILAHDILKFNCYVNKDDSIEELTKYLEINKNKLVNTPYGGTIYEITAAGVSKAIAVKRLANILNVDENNVYIYGDGKNDVSMLKMFNNSYAPSNASKEAKQAAKHIIGDNRCYSVIHHMLKISKNR